MVETCTHCGSIRTNRGYQGGDHYCYNCGSYFEVLTKDNFKWLDKYIEKEIELNGPKIMNLIHDVAEAIEKYGDSELDGD